MEWYTIAIMLVLGIFLFLAMGMPVAFTLGILALGSLYFLEGPISLKMLGSVSYRTAASYILTAIPLFVFMGEMLFVSGIGANLFDMASKWLGWLPGGLAIGGIGATAIFGAMSGASTAGTATMAPIAVPEMVQRGYKKELASGTICAAASLVPIIPPSVIAIVYAVTAEQSIGELFMACLIPGITLAIVMSLLVILWVRIYPGHAPKTVKTTWKEKLSSVPGTWPALILIFLVLVTIYTGIATATEAAALGALGSLLIAFQSRRLTWVVMQKVLMNTMTTTCMILFIMICSSLFTMLLATQGITAKFAAFVVALETNRWLLLAIIMLLYIVMGCFIDVISVILITSPIVLPIITNLGFDLVWFGAVLMVNFATAVITPPFALNIYVMKKVVPDLTLKEITLGTLPFLIADLVGLVLVIAFPQLALWLPSMMKI